jgi:hypothetical protein
MDHRHPAERSTISAYINRFRNSPPRPPNHRSAEAEGEALPAFWWHEHADGLAAGHQTPARNHFAPSSSVTKEDACLPVSTPLMPTANVVVLPPKQPTSGKFVIEAGNPIVSDAPTAEVLARAMAVINSSRKMFEEGALAMPARLTSQQRFVTRTEGTLLKSAQPDDCHRVNASVHEGQDHASSLAAARTPSDTFVDAIAERNAVNLEELPTTNTSTVLHSPEVHDRAAHAKLDAQPAATAPRTPSHALSCLPADSAGGNVESLLHRFNGLDLYVEPAAISIEDPEVTIARLRKRLAIMDHEIAPILAPYVSTADAVQDTPYASAVSVPSAAVAASAQRLTVSVSAVTRATSPDSPFQIPSPRAGNLKVAEHAGSAHRLVTTAVSNISVSPQPYAPAGAPLMLPAQPTAVQPAHAVITSSSAPPPSGTDEFSYEREVPSQVRGSYDSSFSFLWDLSDEESVNMTPAATAPKLPNSSLTSTGALAIDKAQDARLAAESALPPRYGTHRQPDIKNAPPCDASVQTDTVFAAPQQDISPNSSLVVTSSGIGLPPDLNALLATVKPIVIFVNGAQQEPLARSTAAALDIPTPRPASPPAAQSTFRVSRPVPPIVHIPPLPALSTHVGWNLPASMQPLQ